MTSVSYAGSFMIKCVNLKEKWGQDNCRISMQYPHFYLNESISFLATMKAEVDVKIKKSCSSTMIKTKTKIKDKKKHQEKKATIYNIYSNKVWSLSVTYYRSVLFFGYSGFLHQ